MVYSHSQLKTFDECQLRFRYKYIDKIPEPATTPSPALQFGSIIHKCLELLYKKIQSSGKPLTKEEVVDFFHIEMWRFRHEYDLVSELPFSQNDFDERILLGEQMIDRYYDTYTPFNETKVNGLEQNINFELPNTSKFRGVIDRLDILWDRAIIVDYKTDKSIAPYWTFADTYQQQLTSYAYRVMNNYPHVIKSVTWKLIYLRLQQEITREITSEMLQHAIDTIVKKIGVIEDTLFHYNMGQKDVFVPTEWIQCRRCAYQVMCPLWKHRFQDDEKVLVSEIGETTIKKLVDKFYHLNKQMKELKDNLDGIKGFLEEYVYSHAEEEWKKLYWEEGEVKIDYKNEFKPRDDKNIEFKQLLLNEGLLDLITMQVNTSRLTRYLSDNPEKMVDFALFIEQKEKYTVWWAREKKE
jgi:putative RecB family exonuclease